MRIISVPRGLGKHEQVERMHGTLIRKIAGQLSEQPPVFSEFLIDTSKKMKPFGLFEDMIQ